MLHSNERCQLFNPDAGAPLLSDAHWHVLGAGAIGCLYADALKRGGSDVSLLLREGQASSVTDLVVEHEGRRSTQQLPQLTPADCHGISRLLITTKAYDVRNAVAGVAHSLDDNCTVLLLVNGMGLVEQLQRDFPRLQIYCGTTTEGAYRTAPREIQHAGRGETRIGRQGQQQPPNWFGQWQRALQPCLWDANIETALWAKLAVNCVINPLTALHRCRNGELATRAELAQQVADLCREVSQVSYAAGFTATAQQITQMAANVIAGTANNRSSMLQDVEAARPTEIDYITGYLLQVAADHGIKAPHNRALLEAIKKHDH